MKNQDKPAFACADGIYYQGGLTKYEEFMKAAMGALIESGQHGAPSDLAEFAHDYVQAMFSKIDEHKEREG